MITELINKKDSFEIVRDQLAAILATEVANQKVLAVGAGEDSSLWDIRIYRERSNPWEEYLNDFSDITPLVNVWYDNSNFLMASSDIVERQNAEGIYNVDCYAVGNASDVEGGHNPGDLVSALSLHRVARLVRNILMAGENTYLGLRGLVWQRWVQSTNIFQPQQDRDNVRPVIGARINVRVSFNEFSPQVIGEPLEYIGTTVRFMENGQVIVESDFQF